MLKALPAARAIPYEMQPLVAPQMHMYETQFRGIRFPPSEAIPLILAADD